jgi:hypothetical protein
MYSRRQNYFSSRPEQTIFSCKTVRKESSSFFAPTSQSTQSSPTQQHQRYIINTSTHQHTQHINYTLAQCHQHINLHINLHINTSTQTHQQPGSSKWANSFLLALNFLLLVLLFGLCNRFESAHLDLGAHDARVFLFKLRSTRDQIRPSETAGTFYVGPGRTHTEGSLPLQFHTRIFPA